MAVLTDAIKGFIVKELAMFRSPSEVAKAVHEEFGVEVTRQQVYNYDPLGALGDKVAEKWKALHATTRKAFLEDTSTIAIAQRSYRLRELDRMARDASSRRNFPLAAQLMEQAAKECGDSYTNRQKHEHTGKDGAPLVPDMSEAQIAARAAAILAAAQQRKEAADG